MMSRNSWFMWPMAFALALSLFNSAPLLGQGLARSVPTCSEMDAKMQPYEGRDISKQILIKLYGQPHRTCRRPEGRFWEWPCTKKDGTLGAWAFIWSSGPGPSTGVEYMDDIYDWRCPEGRR
jgi:hypothetical protein